MPKARFRGKYGPCGGGVDCTFSETRLFRELCAEPWPRVQVTPVLTGPQHEARPRPDHPPASSAGRHEHRGGEAVCLCGPGAPTGRGCAFSGVCPVSAATGPVGCTDRLRRIERVEPVPSAPVAPGSTPIRRFVESSHGLRTPPGSPLREGPRPGLGTGCWGYVFVVRLVPAGGAPAQRSRGPQGAGCLTRTASRRRWCRSVRGGAGRTDGQDRGLGWG